MDAKRFLASSIACASLAVATTAVAEDTIPDRYFYLGGHIGQSWLDIGDHYEGDGYLADNAFENDTVTLPGAQIGYRFSENWSVQAWYERNNMSTSDGEVYLRNNFASLRRHFNGDGPIESYVGLGAGETRTEFDAESDRDFKETIGGLEFDFIPEVDKPLVADMSSTILSRPLDVSRFGLIYAGAQKNIGPAGITVVIVRKDLLGRAGASVPAMMNYQIHAENGSMYNTPPTFAWYLAGLVFQWLKEQGGVEAMGEINRRKADKLYGFIDASGFYSNPVTPTQRSWMNVPFILADSGLDKAFLAEADAAGLRNLKGHRSVGGMRASIYNAVPETAVDALIDFMADFEKRNG